MATAWHPYIPDDPTLQGTCVAATPRAVESWPRVLFVAAPILGVLITPPTEGRIWPRRTR